MTWHASLCVCLCACVCVRVCVCVCVWICIYVCRGYLAAIVGGGGGRGAGGCSSARTNKSVTGSERGGSEGGGKGNSEKQTSQGISLMPEERGGTCQSTLGGSGALRECGESQISSASGRGRRVSVPGRGISCANADSTTGDRLQNKRTWRGPEPDRDPINTAVAVC